MKPVPVCGIGGGGVEGSLHITRIMHRFVASRFHTAAAWSYGLKEGGSKAPSAQLLAGLVVTGATLWSVNGLGSVEPGVANDSSSVELVDNLSSVELDESASLLNTPLLQKVMSVADPSSVELGMRDDSSSVELVEHLSSVNLDKNVSLSRTCCYDAEEVSLRDGRDGRPLWVSYKDGVYDLSSFDHPGGSAFLQLAAGGPLETWWLWWAFHSVSAKKPEKILSRFRVGILGDWDGGEAFKDVDFYNDEPGPSEARSLDAKHLVLVEKPLNTEVRTSELAAASQTPSDLLFIRNHAPVPRLAAASHEIQFQIHKNVYESSDIRSPLKGCIDDEDSVQIAAVNLAGLGDQHERKYVTSVLQCAGNRNGDNVKANGTNGLDPVFDSMGVGMVGCVKWGGFSFVSVVARAFADHGSALSNPDDLWFEFSGSDGYRTSVPYSLVMDPDRRAIFATQMNDELLTRDHGFPVRLVLPGVVGARNVKWVEKVVLRRGEGDSPWNQKYYKLGAGQDSDKPEKAPSAMGLVLQSLILTNSAGPLGSGASQFIRRNEDGETVHVKGVAFAGSSGESIKSVQISSDQGISWSEAQVSEPAEILVESPGIYFGWWTFEAELSASANATEVWCRAFTASGAGQPEVPAPSTVLYNGYHKVPLLK